MINFITIPNRIKLKLVKDLELIYFLPLLWSMKRILGKTKMTPLLKSNSYLNKSLASQIKSVNQSYLIESGWFESKLNNSSYSAEEFYPWITFPALDYLNKLSLKDLTILEFGSGASTIYFSNRSKKVISFEFNSAYYSVIIAATQKYMNLEICNFDFSLYLNSQDFKLSSEFEMSQELGICMRSDLNHFGFNAEYFFENDLYVKTKKSILEADLIFIDGGPRNTELLLTAMLAKENAIILVDNTDSYYLKNGIQMLLMHGFKEISFSGLGPLNPYKFQTSIFVKNLDSISDIYNNSIG
jgi:hypothetical protein